MGSITNDAPTTFEFGITTVSWVVSDYVGNTATIQQNISLVDTTEPSIILPNDIEIEAVSNHSNIIEIGVATGSDNIQLGAATMNWSAVANADHYDIRMRVQGSASWTVFLNNLYGTSKQKINLR